MVVNGRPLKRLKRRVTADLNDFLTFPASGDSSPVDTPAGSGPFRTCVQAFLARHALIPHASSLFPLFPHLMTRQVLFRVGDLTLPDIGGSSPSPAVVCLDVVEEDVTRSRSVYCDQCRVVGWSSNPVCTKRYHFIIKADGNSIAGYNKQCAGCGDTVYMSDMSESRCKSCNHLMTAEDVEDWIYHQLEDTTHLLHGVVHTNGFGHLLRVNGRESGSRLLSGRDIMNFWDRLCKFLGVRKVSVTDVSKKYGLEFRLLHAVTHGQPWYGDWGYEFGAGSFGLTRDSYGTAVENLSSLPLSLFLSQGRKPRAHLQDLISFYQSLSERELVNIRDLFKFLMKLIHDAHKSPTGVDSSLYLKLRPGDCRTSCSWTDDDVTRVQEAMFKVLRAVTGSNWVSWRALKGAVCKVGPPELLDYCLKELNGKQAADGLVVTSRCLPASGAMEYRLEPGNAISTVNKSTNFYPASNNPSEERILRDLRYLFEAMVCPQTISCHLSPAKRNVAIAAATVLLDCKQFVKDYQPEKFLLASKPHAIQLLCEVDMMEYSEENVANPPPELLILSSDATIADLKLEACKAFQEVYILFRRFQAEELMGYGGVGDTTQVKLLLGSAEFVRVKGKCYGKNGLSRFRMERGVERWTVDCSCGAKDDDGERMLACDSCGVWQHTRCSGIHDSDGVPLKYVCPRCIYATRAMKTAGPCAGKMALHSVGAASGNGCGRSLMNPV
ncbi:OLC1v1025220C1 [Oldenlandia corymbosa var. corymbosa]|uniref:OLC1v1025220C1 n=1 Tax=Oldenlandia corymbosa var. corymbosa TaxID=529605 RepID=A0AAV1C713_OLDCO|nr:OLC1v1025220C1 [Oldenlandia corymbosa var. corymbosa]